MWYMRQNGLIWSELQNYIFIFQFTLGTRTINTCWVKNYMFFQNNLKRKIIFFENSF